VFWGQIQQPTRRSVLNILDRKVFERRNEGRAWPTWLLGLLAVLIVSITATAQAEAQTRSLKVYFIHTKERAEITYMRNGRYVQSGLDQLNRFLRDWRQNEPTKMDPRLFDMLWEVYRATGARDHIHIVSAYRSPKTNAMLRSRSSGVADKSQHMLGKAIDFYIPGVKLSSLRAAALKMEGGGVGYYPKSGAPFVHLDVGSVRHWPRMNRNELMAVFPDGRTIHVPSDGKPLPGFEQAMASYESRKRSGNSIQIASAGASSGNRSGGGLLANLFRGGGADDEEDVAESAAPARQQPARQQAAPEPQRQVPAPVVETPETIIAALPARSVPLPGAAPRPSVGVGENLFASRSQDAAAPVPQEAVPVAAVPAPVEPAVEETAVALNIPLPTRRPDFTPEVPAPTQVAAVPTPAPTAADDVAVASIAGQLPRSVGSDAITELLAMSAEEARADVVINDSARPAIEGVASAVKAGAGAGDVFVLASLPQAEAIGVARDVEPELAPTALSIAKERASAAPVSDSPRVAMLGSDGRDAAAALESGVRTTAKSARPRAGDGRPDRKPVVVPVGEQVTQWMLKPDLGSMGVAPVSASEEVRAAPRQVYTQGFQQGGQLADANRFTGKAVTFMSVARFN
jgi:uncharacterized protein YcbK (DUF882 family)